MSNMNAPEGTKPNPDPTIATNEAVERAMKSERDYVDGKIEVLLERMRGMDTATELLSETTSKVPSDIKEAVDHSQSLTAERFDSVAQQFKERDIRAEREARDNKVAVDAAFAAQKEAAAKQDEANAKAIDKSEKATAETIKTNQDLSKSTSDALTKSLDELKLQVGRIEAANMGARAQRTETREGITSFQAIMATIAVVVVLVGTIIAANVKTDASPSSACPAGFICTTTP